MPFMINPPQQPSLAEALQTAQAIKGGQLQNQLGQLQMQQLQKQMSPEYLKQQEDIRKRKEQLDVFSNAISLYQATKDPKAVKQFLSKFGNEYDLDFTSEGEKITIIDPSGVEISGRPEDVQILTNVLKNPEVMVSQELQRAAMQVAATNGVTMKWPEQKAPQEFMRRWTNIKTGYEVQAEEGSPLAKTYDADSDYIEGTKPSEPIKISIGEQVEKATALDIAKSKADIKTIGFKNTVINQAKLKWGIEWATLDELAKAKEIRIVMDEAIRALYPNIQYGKNEQGIVGWFDGETLIREDK